MINFKQKEWFNKNDTASASKRIPFSASNFNRIEEGVGDCVEHINHTFGHWWEKKRLANGSVSNLTYSSSKSFYFTDSSSEGILIYYSDSVDIKTNPSTGEIYSEFKDYETFSYVGYSNSGSNYYYDLQGKYIIFNSSNESFDISTMSGGDLYYIDGGFTRTRVSSGSSYKYGISVSAIYSTILAANYSEPDYVYSYNVDKYREGWNITDQAYYKYLGTPFENARNGERTKVTYGYYIGAGECGKSTPNTLMVNPTTKLVIIKESNISDMYDGFTMIFRGETISGTTNYSVSSYKLTCKWTDDELIWYNTSSSNNQLNSSGTIYNYILIDID